MVGLFYVVDNCRIKPATNESRICVCYLMQVGKILYGVNAGKNIKRLGLNNQFAEAVCQNCTSIRGNNC